MTTPVSNNKTTLQDYFTAAKTSNQTFSADDIQQALNTSAGIQHTFLKTAGAKAGMAAASLAAVVGCVYMLSSHPRKALSPIGVKQTVTQNMPVREIPASPKTALITNNYLVPAQDIEVQNSTDFAPLTPLTGYTVSPTGQTRSTPQDSSALAAKAIHFLVLDKATLCKLGISVSPAGDICRNMNDIIICYGKSGTMVITNIQDSGNVELNFETKSAVHVAPRTNTYIDEYLVTDDLGKAQRAVLSHTVEGVNKLDYSTLVPVLVRSGLSYTAEDARLGHWRPDVIFWFRPMPQFFDALPDSIRNTLASEYKYITATPAQKETLPVSNCEYFEQCRATLNDISALKVYPNPAERDLHVSFTSASAQNISIEITNVAGQHVAQLMPMKAIQQGANDLQFQLPPMPTGMYLLVITSADGKVVTERLVRK